MEMSIKGVDTAARISADKAQLLYEKGVRFVGRYLVPPEFYDKAIITTEAAGLLAAGLGILLCWETSGDRVKGGAPAGATDGARAAGVAERLNIPETVTIYFAVDYNAQPQEYDAIEYYFRSAIMACGPYSVGVYGSRSVVEMLAARLPGIKTWQCVAWSKGVSELANVYQYQWQGGEEARALAAEVGFAVDMDCCTDLAAAGLWLPEDKKPWYAEDLAWCAEKGIINDGRPNDAVTRAELSAVTHRLYNAIFEDMNRPSGLLTDD